MFSVAPDAIHLHVKTCRENLKNMHCIAPEYGGITIRVTLSTWDHVSNPIWRY